MNNFKIYETFAGVGSQFYALKKVNENTESIGYCEWLIPAIIAYEILHYGKLKPETNKTKEEMIDFLNKYNLSQDSKKPVKRNYWKRKNIDYIKKVFPYLYRSIVEHNNSVDITTIEKLPKDIDILTYSFPCQDLSIQGKREGIKENTRSGLLYEIKRILLNNQDRLPKILLLENVKNLVQKKFIDDFKSWLMELEKLGYKTDWKVLNSVNFGSSQRRERVFALSSIDENIILPSFNNSKRKVLKDILVDNFEQKYFNDIYESTDFKVSNNNIKRRVMKNFSKFDTRCRIYDINHNGPTLQAGGSDLIKLQINKRKLLNYSSFNSENYIYNNNNVGPTLTATGANSNLKIQIDKDVRYLNVIESFLYMGFKQDDFYKIYNEKLISNNKLIFLMGNSIVVEVLESIFENIKKGEYCE